MMIFFKHTNEINNDLYNFINSTLQNLNKQSNLQKNKKDNLVILTDKLSKLNVENSSKINATSLLSTIEELKICLENIRTNTEDIDNLTNQLKKILNDIDNHEIQNIETNLSLYYTLYVEKQNIILEKDLKKEKKNKKIYEFNNFYDCLSLNELKNLSDQIENTETVNLVNSIDNLVSDLEKNTNITPSLTSKPENISESITSNEINQPIKDNNTLTISETKNKVFLPYKVIDLEKKLNENSKKYENMQDLINKEYIVPLSKYKNSSISRFKEAYLLMKNREHASFMKCIDLALELAFKYNLNPAVISACKNLDELDIYLDCLDDLALDDFKLFDIKYEIPPAVQS